MQNNNIEKKEKMFLKNFLYKNSNILDSIYSQVFSGITSNINLTKSIVRHADKDITNIGDFGVPFVANLKSQLKFLGSRGTSKSVVTNKTPFDYKIVELLNKLKLNEEIVVSKTISNYPRLVLLNGEIQIRNLHFFKLMLSKTIKNNPSFFYQNIYNSDRSCFNIPYFENLYGFSFLDFISEFITDKYELKITLENNTTITGVLDETYIEPSIKNNTRVHNDTSYSSWSILGVLSPIELNSSLLHDYSFLNNNCSFEFLIDVMGEFAKSQIYSNSYYKIQPIVIYQTYTY